jgi:putative chitinase
MIFLPAARISTDLLRAVGANDINARLYAPLLDEARIVPGDSFNTITSRQGIAMLVCQLAHESSHFSTLSENLNYSVQALKTDNRRKYFTNAQAEAYGYVRTSGGVYLHRADQKMIANLYYGGRLGNRGVDTDDGWVFRGGGLIQLTGRANFTAFGKAIGRTPEEAAAYVRTPQGAVASALWFWRTNNLLIPASRGDVVACTKIINGGDAGLQERKELYKAALSALG